MKVACKQAGLIFPQVGIVFEQADAPYEVTEEQAKILLTNGSIYEYGGKSVAKASIPVPKSKDKVIIEKKGNSFADIQFESEVDK